MFLNQFSKDKNTKCVSFANFRGINTPTMASLKLPRVYQLVYLTISSLALVWAHISLLFLPACHHPIYFSLSPSFLFLTEFYSCIPIIITTTNRPEVNLKTTVGQREETQEKAVWVDQPRSFPRLFGVPRADPILSAEVSRCFRWRNHLQSEWIEGVGLNVHFNLEIIFFSKWEPFYH